MGYGNEVLWKVKTYSFVSSRGSRKEGNDSIWAARQRMRLDLDIWTYSEKSEGQTGRREQHDNSTGAGKC